MSVNLSIVELRSDFLAPQAPTTSPGSQGWTKKDTSAAGSPTCQVESAKGMRMRLAATNEVENLCLYDNDVLNYKLGDLQLVQLLVSAPVVAATDVLVFGVASARSDNEETITNSAWFKIQGSASTSAVVVETDDGVIDNNDIATGATLGTVPKLLTIDFQQGIADVRFFIDDKPVATTKTFDMSNAADNYVQRFLQIRKTGGTGQAELCVHRYRIRTKMSLGA